MACRDAYKNKTTIEAKQYQLENQLHYTKRFVRQMQQIHTCPINYLPNEMFMSTRQNAIIKRKPRKAKSKKLFKPDIDRSTEKWLGELEKKLNYEVWFCGHYHIDKQLDKVYMMCHEIRPLHMQMFSNE